MEEQGSSVRISFYENEHFYEIVHLEVIVIIRPRQGHLTLHIVYNRKNTWCNTLGMLY